MGMFGAIAMLPLYLQIVQGATPTEAGLQSLPLVLGIMSMSIMSGRLIARTGRYKVWPVLGVSLMIVGIGLLSRIGLDTPYWQVALIMVVTGWGLGGIMQPLVLAVQNAMPARDMGVATASATFFRQMGGTVGTAVFLSLLFSTVAQRVADAFRAAATDPAFQARLRDPAVLADPANAPILAARGGAPALDDSSFLAHADPVLARPVLEGFAGSLGVVFLTAAAVLVLALLAVLAMKEVPLRTQSGVDAIAADQRAADERAAAGGPVADLDATAVPIAVPADGAPDGPAAPQPAKVAVLERADPAPDRDVRDRLLAMLLPDPERALAVVGNAERARDALRAARRDVATKEAELTAAVEELVAQGLSPAQVQQLLGLADVDR
jgi:hypothetical protein